MSKREEGIRGRADFLDRLRRNLAFGRLVRFFDSGRLSRFEELCWLAHCASLRNELTGAPAKRALSHLLRLRQSLGNCAWLKQSVVTSLEQLQDELEKLARRVKRGRREDHTAQVFRDAAEVFVCGGLDLRERRLPSRDSVDEALAGVFAVVYIVRTFWTSLWKNQERGWPIGVEVEAVARWCSRRLSSIVSRLRVSLRFRLL